MASDSTNIWNYREELTDHEMTGFDVEATDGSIGKIDESSFEADNSHIVVDTGFWIFGKKRLIPAGAVTGVDFENKKVMIGLSKEQIKGAPDFEREHSDDASSPIQRSNYNEYYGPHGW
ncbi:MAG TPA: PRC-barrel domain-containing protein [Ilumatobacteraceae bacterium]|nr:PRC-barrel domain-containing protein [Ilumatobacteraceae bacterium]